MLPNPSAAELRTSVPTPRGFPLVGVLPRLLRDPFRFLMRTAREHDGIVRLRVAGREAYLLSRPDYMHQVLVERPQVYQRGAIFDTFRAVIGEGLFTADGAVWKKHRRIMTPVFHRAHVRALIQRIVETIDEQCAEWRPRAERGDTVDMFHEMIVLNTRILLRTLFGTQLRDADARALVEATAALFLGMNRGLWAFFLPARLPLPGRTAVRRAMAVLDEIVTRLITERSATPQGEGDLLGLLLDARDEESNESLSEHEVRDEIFTMILAGYESTAASLAWAWTLLGRNPGVDRRLAEEVDAVLGDRVPGVEDFARLPVTRRILDETLRLYPSFPMGFRTAMTDDMIGGYPIPAGSIVIWAMYAAHRDPDVWPEPERFDPDRFLPERFTEAQRHAYLPFGAGQRMCIGKDLALTEAMLVLAMVSRRFARELVRDDVEEAFALTVHPKRGVPMRLRARDAT
jgi:cytochrome P450